MINFIAKSICKLPDQRSLQKLMRISKKSICLISQNRVQKKSTRYRNISQLATRSNISNSEKKSFTNPEDEYSDFQQKILNQYKKTVENCKGEQSHATKKITNELQKRIRKVKSRKEAVSSRFILRTSRSKMKSFRFSSKKISSRKGLKEESKISQPFQQYGSKSRNQIKNFPTLFSERKLLHKSPLLLRIHARLLHLPSVNC